MSPTRGNFQDPLGLVRRMLLSRDRAAWSALAGAGASVAAIPVDRLLANREQRLIERASAAEYPLILVVGGARTGTTVLYQLLVGHLPVSYIPNLSAAFPRAPLTATAAFMGSWDRQIKSTSNYYGQTPGPRGPNDGFHVWNRWLGDDRYEALASLDSTIAEDMRRFFGAWCSLFPRPFVNKNNRNTARIGMLATALPTAVFVAISREPFFAAQSLVRARREVQGDEYIGWGLNSRDSSSHRTDSLAYLDDIADQVYRTEQMLDRQLSELSPRRMLHISYEELCADPVAVLEQVSTLAGGGQPRFLRELAPLRNTNQVWLPADARLRLENALARRF